MLTVLKIKNLALVDDLTWDVGRGLVGITGQTGAGKSMIIGALKLVLGERANHDLIRHGETTCTVEAVFELSTQIEQVNELLENGGIDPCEGNLLVVRRVFGTSGGNKQFVNCSPATLTVLKSIGKYLVDLHGPHEHQSLLSQERQLDLLDAYIQDEKQVADYRKAYSAWHRAQRELEEFRSLRMATGQEIDLLRYQSDEIDNAGLDIEEVVEMEKRYALCRNGARLVDAANHALIELSGNVVGGLGDVQRSLRDLEKYDPSVKKWSAGFDEARVELEEIEAALRDYVGDLEFDPAEIVQMEQRIDQLESLKRKYGQTIEDVIEYGETARDRLSKIDGHEEELHRLEKAVLDTLGKAETMGDRLTRLRRKAAPKLAKEIAGHLEDLGFKQSIFDVSLQTGALPNSRGFEEADFLFAPNPGEPPKPLRIIASSGEMSRVMLAIKSALAHEDQIPLMVFDEIDANVGGEIAHAVGRKMAALGKQHQVVAITHMPQVAALAHCHYVVSKEFGEGETHSTLRQVKNKRRVKELARMLGGIGDQSMALAESLLVA